MAGGSGLGETAMVLEEGGSLAFLTHFHPLLSPEIRMSKPLEAEKQGLDSPSEHTGVWGAEGGQAGWWERRGSG